MPLFKLLWFEGENWNVRWAALKALGQISEKGDQQAITAMSARLEHEYKDVRSAAVGALGQIGEKGDQQAIAACRPRLAPRLLSRAIWA